MGHNVDQICTSRDGRIVLSRLNCVENIALITAGVARSQSLYRHVIVDQRSNRLYMMLTTCHVKIHQAIADQIHCNLLGTAIHLTPKCPLN
jgi:hypothetical protein